MEKVQRTDQQQTIALHLASIMQRWSEICRRGVDSEISPELQYYMAGRSDAHQMDAARCRSASTVSSQHKPPDDLMRFSQAYEIILGMLEAATVSDNDHEEEPAAVEFSHEEPLFESPLEVQIPQFPDTTLGRLRARALKLVSPSSDGKD